MCCAHNKVWLFFTNTRSRTKSGHWRVELHCILEIYSSNSKSTLLIFQNLMHLGIRHMLGRNAIKIAHILPTKMMMMILFVSTQKSIMFLRWQFSSFSRISVWTQSLKTLLKNVSHTYLIEKIVNWMVQKWNRLKKYLKNTFEKLKNRKWDIFWHFPNTVSVLQFVSFRVHFQPIKMLFHP